MPLYHCISVGPPIWCLPESWLLQIKMKSLLNSIIIVLFKIPFALLLHLVKIVLMCLLSKVILHYSASLSQLYYIGENKIFSPLNPLLSHYCCSRRMFTFKNKHMRWLWSSRPQQVIVWKIDVSGQHGRLHLTRTSVRWWFVGRWKTADSAATAARQKSVVVQNELSL